MTKQDLIEAAKDKYFFRSMIRAMTDQEMMSIAEHFEAEKLHRSLVLIGPIHQPKTEGLVIKNEVIS